MRARLLISAVPYKWIVLSNTTLAMLIVTIDASIVSIALPDVTRTIGASVAEAMWVVIGYSVVTSALLLPFARLADMRGRVRLYNLGFALFTLSSALCGLAQTGTQLVIFRLIQGVSAALLSANSAALVTDAFPAWQRGFALSINMMAGVSGFVIGTLLGGVITEFLGWRYIFLINVPIGTFATIWAFFQLKETGERDNKAHFDPLGMITFPLGIASILLALTMVVMGRAADPLTYSLFAVGVGALVAFLFIEGRARFPMMDLSLFRIRLFWAGNTSLLLSTLGRGSTVFMMTWYFQVVLNDSPLVAGLKLLPFAAMMLVLAPIAGRLSDRFGSRWLSTSGLGCTLLAQLCLVIVPVDVPYPILAIVLALLGFGSSLFIAPNTTAVMNSVPTSRRGVTAGMRNLVINTGQTTAIAWSMVVLSTVMSYQLLTQLFAGSAPSAQSVNAGIFMQGLHEIFLVGAAINVLAIICSAAKGSDIGKGCPSRAGLESELVPGPVAEPSR